jgi:hypothetical protein
MLRISLDEAYVFDLLSIYQVKIDNAPDQKLDQLKKTYEVLSNEIIDQIGQELFSKIISSIEYYELIKINQIVFDLVDRANETQLSKLTADANYQRYIKKIELQNEFFKNTITEVKL